MNDFDLSKILYDPEKSRSFTFSDKKTLNKINIELGSDYNSGLISSDQTTFYPITENIPIMLCPISLNNISQSRPKTDKSLSDTCEIFDRLWEKRKKNKFPHSFPERSLKKLGR